MMPLAPGHALAYPCHRRLGNALKAAPRSVIAVFLCPDSAQDSGCQLPIIGRLAGCAFRKGARCTFRQFPNPASRPAPKPGFIIHSWSRTHGIT